MLGNKDNNSIETHEFFFYFWQTLVLIEALKSQKGKWIGVLFQCRNRRGCNIFKGLSWKV